MLGKNRRYLYFDFDDKRAFNIFALNVGNLVFKYKILLNCLKFADIHTQAISFWSKIST